MNKITKSLIGGTIAASITLISSAALAADKDKILGTINGENVTQGQVMTFIMTQGPNSGLNPQNPNSQAQFLKLFLEREALYHEANALNIAKRSQEQLEEARRQKLAQLVVEEYVANHKPTDKQIEDFYKSEVVANSKEFKLRHIQVQSPDQAKALYERLEKGEDFANIANTTSDSAEKNGGELGWLSLNAMPPSFAIASRTLKAGQYSPQVLKSDRGLHIIKIDETRAITPPPLEQVKAQISDALTKQAMSVYIAEIKEKYQVVPVE